MNAGFSTVAGVWVRDEQSSEQVLVANLLPDQQDFLLHVTGAGIEMECALLWQNSGAAWCALALEGVGGEQGSYQRVGFLNSMNMWEDEYPAVKWADVEDKEIIIV